MRFLVDNQLPPLLAGFLRERGHEATHVFEKGLHELDDRTLWERASAAESIVISKDEDFLYLANRPGERGKLLWVRLGNCRNANLIDAFSQSLARVIAAFESGHRVVELT
jgi:predicted nuclease of predicted toxin-antitoxin system